MRLLTHNQLMCIRRGCPKQYPLTLNAQSVEQEETTTNQALIAHLMVSIDYSVLYDVCKLIGVAAGLPAPDQPLPNWTQLALLYSKRLEENASDDDDDNDSTDKAANQSMEEKEPEDDHSELLNTLHTVLMDTQVQEGELVCQGCKRHYLIQQGIPNMRLNEDEV
jgi:uncharacterized protein YbaR (Trm112 family)